MSSLLIGATEFCILLSRASSLKEITPLVLISKSALNLTPPNVSDVATGKT